MMKKITFLLAGLFLAILLLPKHSLAHDLPKGEWRAYCVVKQIDRTLITFSNLCQIVLSEDHTTLSFSAFDILVDDESISIIHDDAIKKTVYKFDNELRKLIFTLDDEEHTLKVLSIMDKYPQNILLKDDDSFILLEKKN